MNIARSLPAMGRSMVSGRRSNMGGVPVIENAGLVDSDITLSTFG
jgi:hypothetical protein